MKVKLESPETFINTPKIIVQDMTEGVKLKRGVDIEDRKSKSVHQRLNRIKTDLNLQTFKRQVVSRKETDNKNLAKLLHLKKKE